MKLTTHDIQEYLNNFNPNDDINRRAIVHLCQEYGHTVNFEQKQNKLCCISFRKFERWLFGEPLQHGEIVVIKDENKENLILIVNKAFPNYIIPEATLTSNNIFTYDAKKVNYDGNYREATECELLKLQISINNNGLSWNGKYKKLIKNNKSVLNNTQVRLTIAGRRIGIGIFNEINSDGDIVMYCVKMDNEDRVRYSMYEIIGPASHYQLDTIHPLERKELTNEFSSLNLYWNGQYKRVEPISYRKRLNKYYFINSLFKVQMTVDKGNTSDTRKYNRLNYFRKIKFAEGIIEAVTEMQSEYEIKRVFNNERYYYIDQHFYIIQHVDTDSEIDKKRYRNKNYFNLKIQAERVLEKIMKLRKLQLLNNNAKRI